MTCNTFNNPVSKQSSLALKPEDIERQIYSFNTLIKIENDPTARYDLNTMIRDVGLTTSLFETIPNRQTLFPTLYERITQGPITVYEYADFLDYSGFDLTTVDNALIAGITQINRIDYFNQLDFYYNDNLSASIEGGFCSTFSGILNKLTKVISLINSGVVAISNIQGLIGQVIGQLTSIKNIIFGIIDRLVGYMKEQIAAVLSKVTSLVNQTVAVVNVIRNKALKVATFYEDFKIDSLKKAIESFIASIGGNYEELTPEVIAYLMFRFCQLIEMITNFMQNPVEGLKSFVNRFALEQLKLTNVSNTARLDAVRSGLYRMDPFTITAVREQIAKNVNTAGAAGPALAGAAYITMPITEEEARLLNSLTESGNQYIQWSPQVLNMGSIVNDAEPGDGWKKLNGDVIIRAMRIARRMGARLYINSGYRSPQYNAKRDGAVSGSLHMSGKALDVSMTNSSGLSNTQESRNNFIKIASQEGITGIGTYNSFIHIDIGNRRTWGSLQTEALSLHKQDRFRTGGTPTSSGAI